MVLFIDNSFINLLTLRFSPDTFSNIWDCLGRLTITSVYRLLALTLQSSISSDVFNIDTEKEVMGLLEQLSITAPTCEDIKELILIYKERGNSMLV